MVPTDAPALAHRLALIFHATQKHATSERFDEALCIDEVVEPVTRLVRCEVIYEVVLIITYGGSGEKVLTTNHLQAEIVTPTKRYLNKIRMILSAQYKGLVSIHCEPDAVSAEAMNARAVEYARRRGADGFLVVEAGEGCPSVSEVMHELATLEKDGVRQFRRKHVHV